MEFTFETVYDNRTLSAMAKGLRKTVRKKRTRRSHVFGWIVAALAMFFVISSGKLDFRSVITILAALAIIIALVFEDRLNGYVAQKRLLPGTQKAITIFTDASFSSATEAGKTEWNYDKIGALAETDDYFLFLFSSNHAQAYDKRNLSGGTAEQFRSFIQEKTDKPMIKI